MGRQGVLVCFSLSVRNTFWSLRLSSLCSLQLAYQRGMITKVERERVFNVMRSLGLALWHEVCTVDLLMQVMLLTIHSVP